MLVLGIETSCDETAAAVVRDGREILANVVRSQIPLHRPFGGVVPEIACRAHVEDLTRVVDRALEEAGVTHRQLDGVAVANRPGLIGALLVGLTTAKARAWAWKLPLIAVNHIEAHLYAARLATEEQPFPAVGAVFSGGHTALYDSRSVDSHQLLGSTTDDAVGEAFDKVASVLALGYPGGPAIASAAESGNPEAFRLPRTLLGADSLDFSFSGIKTAVLYLAKGQNARRDDPIVAGLDVSDVAASFQEAVIEVLLHKIRLAQRRLNHSWVLVGGGVAANCQLRCKLSQVAEADGFQVLYPPEGLSTDNAAMIAGLAEHRLRAGHQDPLETDAFSTV